VIVDRKVSAPKSTLWCTTSVTENNGKVSLFRFQFRDLRYTIDGTRIKVGGIIAVEKQSMWWFWPFKKVDWRLTTSYMNLACDTKDCDFRYPVYNQIITSGLNQASVILNREFLKQALESSFNQVQRFVDDLARKISPRIVSRATA